MKTFLKYLKEDLSMDVYSDLEDYEQFPPSGHLDNEEEYYDDIEFLDFPHYMKTQIETLTNYIIDQGIGQDSDKLKQALSDVLMDPEIQRSFRLHYARKFPNKVKN